LCGIRAEVLDRPSIATNEPRWALPPLLLVTRYALSSSPIPADLTLPANLLLIVNRQSLLINTWFPDTHIPK